MKVLFAILTLGFLLVGCGNPVSVEGHTYLGHVMNTNVTISFHKGVETIKTSTSTSDYDYTLKDRIVSDSNGGKFQVSADGMEITGIVTWDGRVFEKVE